MSLPSWHGSCTSGRREFGCDRTSPILDSNSTPEVGRQSEEDVNVDIENNILTIRGEKREAHEEADEGGRYHVSERRYGSFHRRFTLPRSVEADTVQAEFEGGILTVRLPKAAEAKSRTIEIASKTK